VADVVQLYQSMGINAIHILQALRGSGIDVVVDETNLDALISDATGWVQANVNPTRTTSSSSPPPSAATRRR
jgi:hypothetical protein